MNNKFPVFSLSSVAVREHCRFTFATYSSLAEKPNDTTSNCLGKAPTSETQGDWHDNQPVNPRMSPVNIKAMNINTVEFQADGSGMTGPIHGRLYHGIPFDKARFWNYPSCEGTFGSGYYLGDKRCALVYADEGDGFVVGFDVCLRTPYFFKQTSDMEEGEIYGIGFAKAVLGADHPTIRKVYETGDLYFGTEIEEALTDQGHDGAYIEYEDGTYELVAYNGARLIPAEILEFSDTENSDALVEADILPDCLQDHFRKGRTITQFLLSRADIAMGSTS